METIRQTCPQCQSTLELPSSAIGRMARCPACQLTFRVPSMDVAAPAVGNSSFGNTNLAGGDGSNFGTSQASGGFSAPLPGVSKDQSPASGYGTNPYSASSPPAPMQYGNPYAFSPGMASTSALQVDKSSIAVRTASIDQIVSSSFSIFGARWQPLVLCGLIYFVFAVVFGGINIGINMAVEAGELEFGPVYMFLAASVMNMITWYFSLGLMNVGLMAARGIETGPSKMFVSPNIFGRLLILLVVLTLVSAAPNLLQLLAQGDNEALGAVLTLVGFTFVGLISGLVLWTIWPIFLLVIDDRGGEGGGLALAFQIGTSNLLNSFLMGLMVIVLGIAATFTCGLGTIVTQPLTMLLASVGYLLMTSQPISDPSRTPYQIPNYASQ